MVEKNLYTKEQYDKLPKDVKNSLEKLKIIIEIINDNCIKGKDYTISKLLEKFNTLQAASKIFSKYYLIENISISRYILELRKVKLTKCQPIIPIIDIDEIISNVISIYHNLNELQENSYANIEIKRTNINISKRDDNKFLKMIFSMREYICLDRRDSLQEMINFNFFLENYEFMDFEIRKTETYDALTVMNAYIDRQQNFDENEKAIRAVDFSICYEDCNEILVNGMRYFMVNREKYKSKIKNFILPEDLIEYRTICSKTKYALQLLGRDHQDFENSIKQFENMIEDDLQREVFVYMVDVEDRCVQGKVKNIYQKLKEKRENLSEIEIEKAIKSLIINGFVSLIE